MFNRGLALAALAASTSISAVRVYGFENTRRVGRRRGKLYSAKSAGNFDPRVNRWTGQPHEHKRERARRVRQEARRNG